MQLGNEEQKVRKLIAGVSDSARAGTCYYESSLTVILGTVPFGSLKIISKM